MKISDWTVEIHRVCRIESTEPTEVYSFFKDIENGSGEDLNSLGSPEACWKEYKRPASFLQTDFWVDFKAENGWTPYLFFVKVNKENCDSDSGQNKNGVRLSFYVLLRTIKKFFSIAYVPLAPDLSFITGDDNGDCFSKQSQDATETSKTLIPEPENTPEDEKKNISFFLATLADKIKDFLPQKTVFIRFDPPFETFGNIFPGKLPKPLLKAASPVQPPDTVILDLSMTEEGLLEQMKPKWRYNIRLGEKKGVVVKQGGIEFLDDFYKLYKETAARDGIALHSKKYYGNLLLLAQKNGKNVRVYLACHEGDVLAGIITYFSEKEGVYLYGASSNIKRNLMPAYSLQWRAIRDARLSGCKTYDFYGIPPVEDPNHPMYGLYRFKTGFGGVIVHRAGSFDFPVKRILYGIFSIAEKLRAFYFKKLKKLFVKKGR